MHDVFRFNDDGADVTREMSSDLKAAGLVVMRKLSDVTDGDLPDVPITADVSTDSCNRASDLKHANGLAPSRSC